MDSSQFRFLSEDINQLLLKAIQNGNLKEIKRLLKKGATPEKKGLVDEKKRTALMIAVDLNRVDIIKELIKKKPVSRIYSENYEQKNALMLAAEQGLDDVVTLFISSTAKKSLPRLDMINKHGWNAFDLACINGHVSTMKILADANVITTRAKLLEYMVSKGSVGLVMLLVQNYQNVIESLPDSILVDNVYYAKDASFSDGMKLAIHASDKVLLSMFMDLYNHHGELPLKLIQITCLEALQKGHAEIVGLLVPYLGYNINTPINDTGITMISLAADLGHSDVLIQLIRAGAFTHNLTSSFNLQRALECIAILNNSKLMDLLLLAIKTQGSEIQKRLNDILIESIKQQSDLCAISLIEEGAALDYTNEQGENAIVLAGQYNCFVTLEFCLKRAQEKQMMLKWNSFFELALLRSTKYSHEKTALVLIGKVDSECLDEQYNTPIMWAAKNGLKVAVKNLIQIEAYLNHRNLLNQTALTLSLENGHQFIAMSLLKAGANPLQKNENGQTLIMGAVQKDFLLLANMLVEDFGLPINQRCNKGLNELMYASINGYTRMIKYLLSKKADLETKDINNKTAVMHAFENKQAGAFCALIQGGAVFKLSDKNLNLIFNTCANNSYENIIQLLFDALNLENERHSKPFHEAFSLVISYNMSELIEPFIELGASLSYTYANGYPLIFSCMRHQNLNCLNLLIEKGLSIKEVATTENITLLYACAYIGNFFMVKKLLEINAELLHIPTANGYTPEFVAAEKDHVEILEYLLTKKNSEYLTKKINGLHLIHFASKYGSFKTVEMLLKLKVDVNLLSDNHLTPLMCVAMSRDLISQTDNLVRTADVLIYHNANIELLTPDGKNAMMLAHEFSHKNLMARLLCAMSLQEIKLFEHDNPEYISDIETVSNMVSNAQKGVLSVLGSMWPDDPKKPSLFLSLPMELRAKILSHSYFIPWYENRKVFDINLAVQKINSMIEQRTILGEEIPPAIIFSNPIIKRKADGTDLNKMATKKPKILENDNTKGFSNEDESGMDIDVKQKKNSLSFQ